MRIFILLFLVGSILAPWLVSADPSSRPLVGHVMALLSVFEQADALPTENSANANELIHALIQTQAALTKSHNPATRHWLTAALQAQRDTRPSLSTDALTSRALEAILRHAKTDPPWGDQALMAGFKEFNLSPADFDLMDRVYETAAGRLRTAGTDIHSLYDRERRKMPFQ